MNSIAYCILTYNHPNEIWQVLSQTYLDFMNHGIDLVILDSSTNQDTAHIVEQFLMDGATNLHYLPCDPTITGDEKYLYLLSQSGLPHAYTYIWPSKDRTVFSGNNLDAVIHAMQTNPDVILLTSDYNRSTLLYPVKKEIYRDPLALFQDYGALSTSWESVIYRSDTMLLPTDWEAFAKKYHLGPDNNFNQTVFLFAKLSMISNPKISCIEVDLNHRAYLTSVESTWIQDTFTIFGKKWVSAIESLPEIYNPWKDKVILEETMLPELFGSIDNLFYYYDRGILSEKTYQEIAPIWHRLSKLPVSFVEMIVEDQIELLLPRIISWYNELVSEGKFMDAIWLFQTNSWFQMHLGETLYSSVLTLYQQYLFEQNHHMDSTLFDEIITVKGLLLPKKAVK